MSRAEWRRLALPGLLAFLFFWIFIGLGVWQLHRLTWKLGIIAEIRHAQNAPPIPMPAHPTRFEKVRISGQWVPGKAALYGDEVHNSPQGPMEGAQLIMPLREANGTVVLVDLGWVKGQTPKPMPDLPANPSGYVHVQSRPGWFAAPDDPAHQLYYTLDAQKIGAGLGLAHVAPYMLIALGPKPPPGSLLPEPAQNLPTPPNNHYEYALTWFGFAGVLVFEFIFIARKRLRIS